MSEAASTQDAPEGRAKRARPARARRTDTKDPRRARERALKILFQADVRGVTPDVTLRRLAEDPAARAMLDEVEDLTTEGALLPERAGGTGDGGAGAGRGARSRRTAEREPAEGGAPRRVAGMDGFTRSLVLGVADNQPRIDELIARFARRWQIHRMPVLDRNVLRLGTYELLFEETSAAVVINEAVNLAKALSTDDSGRYVNGVLEAIRRHLVEAAATADGASATAPDARAAGEAGPDAHEDVANAAEPDVDVQEPHAPDEPGITG
jgi:transcription antitermination protein NusB